MVSTLFTLLDDVASLLDDVSVMAKVATKKTAGVLGDDLALNAEQVSGVRPDRELPVVYAVFKGSLKNKAILAPAALVISAVAPWMVTPLLMVGGAYLCFEGVEKLVHKKLEGDGHAPKVAPAGEPVTAEAKLAIERKKIRGAVRTDFVLSAEIITIALGTVADEPLLQRSLVILVIALGMTIGVYGFVAAIVKLDDLGLHLLERSARAARLTGRAILAAAPYLMKALSFAGTTAMFLVGGGILLHGIGPLAELVHGLNERGGIVGSAGPHLANLTMGLASGAVVLGVVRLASGLRRAEAS
ncbi:MAG: DUF808 domain-containing protein [Planctomycetes bacterium]|nr:DUF808 domain-containing protein [Planctomycetota bacterium]